MFRDSLETFLRTFLLSLQYRRPPWLEVDVPREGRSELAHSNPSLCTWQSRLEPSDMSDKKRTTVKTIETHEVWIIRKAVPERPDKDRAAMLSLLDKAQTHAVSTLDEGNDISEIHHGEQAEKN